MFIFINGSKDDVKEELEGAKTYYEKYEETGDTDYKGMASDELRHAGILIKKYMAMADEEHKTLLSEYEKTRQDMLKMISPKTDER